MFGDLAGTRYDVPIQVLFDMAAEGPADTGVYRARILSVTQVGDVASAMVAEDGYWGTVSFVPDLQAVARRHLTQGFGHEWVGGSMLNDSDLLAFVAGTDAMCLLGAEQHCRARAGGLESGHCGDDVGEDERADGDEGDRQCGDGRVGYGVDRVGEKVPEGTSDEDAEGDADDDADADRDR
jgi:hypothetical protein